MNDGRSIRVLPSLGVPWGATIAFCTISLAGWVQAGTAQQRFESTHRAMGVQFRFVLYAESAKIGEEALTKAAARADELDRIFSDYLSDSEIMQLAKRPVDLPLEISPDLWRLLQMSETIRRDSEGAFDVTAGPLTRLWRLARKRNRLPERGELKTAVDLVRAGGFSLVEPSAVKLKVVNMRFDFGGIAKGYAADECLAIFRQMGLESGLVAASGDLALGKAPPGEPGWKVGLASLDGGEVGAQSICLSDCGVATSSDSQQAIEVDGVRYSHIVDPRTGQAIQGRSSVTVIADSAARADAWATALSVLGPSRGMALAKSQEHLEAMMTVETDPRQPPTVVHTEQFPNQVQ